MLLHLLSLTQGLISKMLLGPFSETASRNSVGPPTFVVWPDWALPLGADQGCGHLSQLFVSRVFRGGTPWPSVVLWLGWAHSRLLPQ